MVEGGGRENHWMPETASAVLVVDDDPDLLLVLTTALELDGCGVVAAADGREATPNDAAHTGAPGSGMLRRQFGDERRELPGMKIQPVEIVAERVGLGVGQHRGLVQEFLRFGCQAAGFGVPLIDTLDRHGQVIGGSGVSFSAAVQFRA